MREFGTSYIMPASKPHGSEFSLTRPYAVWFRVQVPSAFRLSSPRRADADVSLAKPDRIEHVLTGQSELDGSIDHFCGHCGENDVTPRAALRAKTATDVRRDDADIFGLEAERPASAPCTLLTTCVPL